MNKIIYYSNTNESYNIASYISSKTNYELINIFNITSFEFDNIFLIFPIHYQNIPKEIKPLIKKIIAKKAIIITTYGKISYGNVLYETKKILNAKVVGAINIPSKHTYIKDDTHFNDYKILDDLINKINDGKEIEIKKTKKNIFSSFFPILRHQLSVKIIKNDNCNNCNLCNNVCKYIENGKIISNKCNRCLKCVINCPNKALNFKLSPIMKKYLKIKDNDS